MKVKVDGSTLLQTRTGVGQYTLNLFNTLAKLDHDNQYSFFGFMFFGKIIELPPLNLPFQFVRYFPGSAYDKLRQRRIAPPINTLVGPADVYIFPNFFRWPLIGRTKSIIIIHDTTYLTHPEYDDAANVAHLEKFVPRSIKQATRVAAVSESAKRDIVQAYGTDPKAITVISPGYDPAEFHPLGASEMKPTLDKFKITKPFILFVGTLNSRKNVGGLIDAYIALPTALKAKYSLVLAGSTDWLEPDVQKRLHHAKNEDIITTGYIADEDRPRLSSAASVLALPSHYEGFGMQLVEAMACGTPVIASDNSSLSEVVGDAGILIPTADTPALTHALALVLTDEKLAANLTTAGLKRAQHYTWEMSARKLKTLIDEM